MCAHLLILTKMSAYLQRLSTPCKNYPLSKIQHALEQVKYLENVTNRPLKGISFGVFELFEGCRVPIAIPLWFIFDKGSR